MLQERVHAQYRVVWLYNSVTNLRATPDREAHLRFFAIIDRKTLQEQAAQPRAGATTASIVNNETLQACAIVGELTQTIEDQVHDLLTDSVVAAGKIIGRILLAANELLWMEQLAVCACSNLINNGGLEIDHHATWHMLPSARLGEKRVEGIIAASNGLVAGHLAIWLDAMLQAEKLPASVADLDAGLAHMDANTLTHGGEEFSNKALGKFVS
jgi:hypothetical protein